MNPYSLKRFHYDLPSELIAQNPLSQRSESKLLVVDRKSGRFEDRVFRNIENYLNDGDLLVANNSEVIPARFLGRRVLEKGQGGRVEIFLLERISGPTHWKCLMRSASKNRSGIKLLLENDQEKIAARIESILSDGCVEVIFDVDPLLSGVGRVPLPPYIERPSERADLERYQTVYAKESGSVAAPTAGLHFTAELIAHLKSKGIDWLELTLHVGLGTFRPVKSEDIREHEMHDEFFRISEEVREKLIDAPAGSVTAVGTTALRTLESSWLESPPKLSGRTDLYIYESNYDFKRVDRLLTNFHLPKSTLLMLVCAFGGYELIMEAYRYAVQNRYRFFSYGDAMLIL